MYTYTIGGKNGRKNTLKESPDRVVVRTRNARSVDKAIVSSEGKETLEDFDIELEFPEADITVFKTKEAVKDDIKTRDNARETLKKEPELRFAGRVLIDSDGKTPVIYTENIFIKFFDQIKPENCEKILAGNNLVIKQKPDYSLNTYFVGAPENTGVKVFEIAEKLLELKEVELCHPELIRKRGVKAININPGQWHLKKTTINGVEINANVKADLAHKLTMGENVIIAIIDDGFDIDHPEFNMPGKVVHARDISLNTNDPRPKAYNDHGTACAGVAAASGINASGVAPKATFMPVRLNSNLGSMAESNAFKWAADHGADIISCSWGPSDGYWADPNDPAHTSMVDIPDSTRLAIDYATNQGRGGKGCIITFAAGNGNEDVKYDGYASYNKVIAIAASNDTNKRSVYSDYGTAVWCCFPSSDFGYTPFNHPEPLTNGIYTTDRMNSAGYSGGNYTDNFGGTSSACPGAAGTIALMLSVNPDLTMQQVKDIIRETAEKIDIANGQYDVQGHSKYYGYGKIDAEGAVKKAIGLKPNKSDDSLKIVSALVNPKGPDKKKEKITLLNTSTSEMDLTGWNIEVKGKMEKLSGTLAGGEARTIVLNGTVKLVNTGTTVNLLNPQLKIVHSVTYIKKQVKSGVIVVF
jgi:subtilisin family serine protease